MHKYLELMLEQHKKVTSPKGISGENQKPGQWIEEDLARIVVLLSSQHHTGTGGLEIAASIASGYWCPYHFLITWLGHHHRRLVNPHQISLHLPYFSLSCTRMYNVGISRVFLLELDVGLYYILSTPLSTTLSTPFVWTRSYSFQIVFIEIYKQKLMEKHQKTVQHPIFRGIDCEVSLQLSSL